MNQFLFTLSTGITLSVGVVIAGTDNEALGTGAGGTQTGNRNVTIGDQAGASLNTANDNTIVGTYAGTLQQDTTGSDGNTVLGFRANGLYTQAEWDAFVADPMANPLPDIDGDGASGLAAANYGIGYNLYIGSYAGLRNYSGSDSTFIGFQAGMSTATSVDNTFLGGNAGKNSVAVSGSGTPWRNTFIGEDAGQSNIHGAQNVYIGDNVALYMKGGNYNVAVGVDSMQGQDQPIGQAQNIPAAGSGMVALGPGSLRDVGDTFGNTAVGPGTLRDVGIGVLNTGMGYHAGGHTEMANYNTFIGALAGLDNNRTNYAGQALRNTAMGFSAGAFNREGNDNVYIGAFADMTDWAQIPLSEVETLRVDATTFSPGAFADPNVTLDRTFQQTVTLGAYSYVNADNNVTIGYDVTSNADNVIALGASVSNANAAHTNTILIGNGVQSRGANQAIIGSSTTTGIEPSADGTIALGAANHRYSSATVATYTAQADAAANASVHFEADGAAANDDQWKIEAQNGGDFILASRATGSFSEIIRIANTGNTVVAGNMSSSSDRRLKQNIQTLENAPDLLSNIQGKTYYWEAQQGRDHKLHYGLIAQEVEAVLPELVSTDAKTGIKSVSYQAFVPLLIDSVNTLKESNDVKEKRVAMMRKQLALQQQIIHRLSQEEGDE